MSMSEDDRHWLSRLMGLINDYTLQRFLRGAEEHSDTPLRQRTCLAEAIQEVNDAQTYLFTFRDRLFHWWDELRLAEETGDWPKVHRVRNQMLSELSDVPTNHTATS